MLRVCAGPGFFKTLFWTPGANKKNIGTLSVQSIVLLYSYQILFGVGIRKQQDVVTPVVCNILDVSGELAAAVASVEAIVS